MSVLGGGADRAESDQLRSQSCCWELAGGYAVAGNVAAGSRSAYELAADGGDDANRGLNCLLEKEKELMTEQGRR